MKVKYYEDADLLSLRISDNPYKFARQDGDLIVHYTENKEPVLIEIVNAINFLKSANKMLPAKVRKEISASSVSVSHRVK